MLTERGYEASDDFAKVNFRHARIHPYTIRWSACVFRRGSQSQSLPYSRQDDRDIIVGVFH